MQFKLFLQIPLFVVLTVDQGVEFSSLQLFIEIQLEWFDVFIFEEILVQRHAIFAEPLFGRAKLFAFGKIFLKINSLGELADLIRFFPWFLNVISWLEDVITFARLRIEFSIAGFKDVVVKTRL